LSIQVKRSARERGYQQGEQLKEVVLRPDIQGNEAEISSRAEYEKKYANNLQSKRI